VPQKKYGPEGPAQPVALTDTQVQAKAAGHTVEVRGLESVAAHSKPRDVTQEDVAARARGEEIDLRSFPELRAAETFEGHSKPRDVTEEDVAARAGGEEIDIENRPPLGQQY